MNRTNFKHTEIGEIPDDWDMAAISEACRINPHDKLNNFGMNTEVSFIPMEAVASDGLGIIQKKSAKYGDVQKGYTQFGEDDVLFAKITPCMENGKVAIARHLINKVGFGSTEFYVLRPVEPVSSEWVFYWVSRSGFRKFATTYFTGTGGQQRVNRKYFDDVRLPLPKKEEQQKIAAVLTTADGAIEKTDEIIEQSKHVKKGLMQGLLTRGIGHKDFKETELGEIPTKWQIVNLWDLADYINGMPFKPSDWKDEGTPIIRIQNLTGLQKEYNYYQGEADSRYYVYSGDILLSWSATLDMFEWKGEKAILNQHIFNVKPHEGFDKKFLFHLLKFHIGRLRSKTHGTGMTHITKRNMRTISIPTPKDLMEQQKIAAVLTTADGKIESEVQKRSQFETLKKGLMQDLLTGRVRFPEFVKNNS